MAISFKGAHFPPDIILMGVRWYVAYPLSYRHVEELLEERGVPIDHATIQRWVVKYGRTSQCGEGWHSNGKTVRFWIPSPRVPKETDARCYAYMTPYTTMIPLCNVY